ncbi:MAG: pyridoxamine 5'-phosphate oxidase family protein [Candidatus Hermodarchaeota archaeon]
MDSKQGNDCQIPEPYLNFLISAQYLYCCTLDQHQYPHIVPLAFTFDIDKSLVLCVTDHRSIKVRNMQRIPYVSFTTDRVHPKNPFLNAGIMLETFVELKEDKNQIADVMAKLQTKYSSLAESNFLPTYSSEILIVAHPMKVVYWKGPFFRRFRCPTWRKRGKLKK